ncbi:MAG: cation transporter [Verrucomicrobiae bacterium]|nr:cation transporter [Verrucomicrobiae bacterium]
MDPYRQGMRAALAGVLVNVGLAVVKIVTGVVGHSYALIADGIESAADTFSSLVVMGGMHVSARPPDEEHPFGHGKAEPLAGVWVATMLLVAAGWIAWHSVGEIRHPQHGPAWFTLPVLAGVVGIKVFLARRVARVGSRIGSVAVRGDAWHHGSDALTSAAAFVGIGIALAGGEGYETADDWAALAVCGVIAWNGVKLLRESANELMDASVAPERVAEIRALAGSVPGVLGIEKCRIRRAGIELTMDIHVLVDGDASVRCGHQIAHAVKDRLLAAPWRIVDVTVHVEPHDAVHGPQVRRGAEGL